VRGPEHPNTLTTKVNLAGSLSGQGKYPEAEALLRQVLEAEERVLGPEHRHTLTTKDNLARSLVWQGKHPSTEGVREEGQPDRSAGASQGSIASRVLMHA
jgi:hypothetical protein